MIDGVKIILISGDLEFILGLMLFITKNVIYVTQFTALIYRSLCFFVQVIHAGFQSDRSTCYFVTATWIFSCLHSKVEMRSWAPLFSITSWNYQARFYGFIMPWELIIVSVWGFKSILKSLVNSLIELFEITSQSKQSFRSTHQLFCAFLNLYAAKTVTNPPFMSIFITTVSWVFL